jgi:hypothetical protein
MIKMKSTRTRRDYIEVRRGDQGKRVLLKDGGVN